MGLDSVELVITLEEHFGVNIPDQEASKIVTVADLYALICRLRVPISTTNSSESTMRALVQSLLDTGMDAGNTDSASRLADLVPARRRHAFWRFLSQRLDRPLPALVCPKSGCVTALISAAICPLVGLAIAMIPGMLIGLLFGFGTAWIATAAFRRWHPQFPALVTTVQDLLDLVGPMTPTQIWHTLVAIISEQLAVRPEDVTMEKRFVQDFHLD